MPKILLAEDDKALAHNIAEWLKLEHYTVEWVKNGTDAIDRLKFYKYDLVILDWMMPGNSGIEVLREFRAQGGNIPVLMLTGKNEISEKETGLDSGADDYLTKPFHLKELSARLRALIRRQNQTPIITNVLKCGDLVLDLKDHHLTKNGEVLHLLPREFSLLEFLMRHPNQIFSADALLDRVWHSSADVSPDSIRTYVARLRAKVDSGDGDSIIQNVHGVGYKLIAKSQ